MQSPCHFWWKFVFFQGYVFVIPLTYYSLDYKIVWFACVRGTPVSCVWGSISGRFMEESEK